MSVNTQLAKNLPITSCEFVTGSVISSSIVPERLSSAHSRIPIAGIKIKNNQGCQAKKAVKSAWSRSKNRPRKKVIPEERAKKTSKKIDARGVLK
jgi:hypothetical protein|tara:strand:+ start:47 stop:331 length:285 start_codon:yes stop_codon:yes gene_type:complete